MRDAHVLERCAPLLDALLAALLEPHGAACAYVVAAGAGPGVGPGAVVLREPGRRHARIPPPGSAAGPLCAYLHRRVRRAMRVVVDQGVAMGRPSRLEAQMDGDRVRVCGDVVIVATGDVQL